LKDARRSKIYARFAPALFRGDCNSSTQVIDDAPDGIWILNQNGNTVAVKGQKPKSSEDKEPIGNQRYRSSYGTRTAGSHWMSMRRQAYRMVEYVLFSRRLVLVEMVVAAAHVNPGRGGKPQQVSHHKWM